VSLYRIPKLRRQKGKNRVARAFVEIDGERRYLGEWGTPEATEAYARLVNSWEAGGRRLAPVPKVEDKIKVVEVIAAHWDWAKAKYAHKPVLYEQIGYALRNLRDLYGSLPAEEFGPKKLKALQHYMATHVDPKTGKTLCRTTINSRVKYVKRLFKWAVSEELIPAAICDALLKVEGLRRGDAREGKKVKPVPEEWVDAIRPYVSEQVEALIDLQYLSGARPGELVKLRPVDIDRSGEIWLYKPEEHKTAHHGEERIIAFVPQAQKILQKFMTVDRPMNAPLFSPKDAEAERNAERRKGRQSPMTPSHRKRRQVRKHRPRPLGDQYTVASYRRAIQRACDEAFPLPKNLQRRAKESASEWWERLTPEQRAEVRKWRKDHRWHPHQLRHSSATYVRKRWGIEAAQVWLGHKDIGTTEVYAEKNQALLLEIAKKFG
jgi:integrase